MQAYESDTRGATLAEIRQHFGFVPAFFAPAQETPEILRQLWEHMRFAYIQSPLPVLFKERLFTYFSRYSRVPYVLICHSCILYSLGINSRELLALLTMRTPTAAEIDNYLTLLASESAPFTEWPATESPLGKALFFCSIFVLLKPNLELSQRCSQQIRRLLGISNYNYLTLFFSFMKTCQTWVETHAEMLPNSDEHIQAQYATLVAEEPGLANFFSTYYQQVSREQQTLSEQLAEKLRESQQLEEALRTAALESTERANKLEAIIEAIADGLMILDDEGRVVEANLMSRYVFSIEKESYVPLPLSELAARSHFELYDEEGHPLSYEQWPAYRALRGERLTGAKAVDVIVVKDEQRRIWLNIGAVPIYDPKGNIIGSVAISRDVTERRRLEGRVRETLDALLKMAEIVVQVPTQMQQDKGAVPEIANPPDQQLVELIRYIMSCRRVGVVTIDPLSEMLHPVAGAWLSAEQKQQWWMEMEHSHLSDVFTPQVIARFHADKIFIFDPHRHAPAQQSPYDFQTVLFVPMRVGEQLIGVLGLEHYENGHKYSGEEIALAQAVARLVTLVVERERLVHERTVAEANELSMRETNRRMDEFLSMASHELKTPLTSIITNIQLAERRLNKLCRQPEMAVQDWTAKVEAIQELLTSADRQVWRLNRLVDELLDVSRIQANKLELRIAPHNLLTIVREAIAQQRQITPQRVIFLQFPIQQDIHVRVDADRIGQVLMNYTSNALKYSDDQQPIEVSVEVHEEEQRVQVCVHDHGPGLPLAEQERIWERFYRVQGIEVQSGPSIGLGLGLHICKRIVERHAGQVGVESSPGQGSTFWFTLPLAE